MNTPTELQNQLYQAKREYNNGKGISYQQIAKLIPSLSTPQVKAVFEDEEPVLSDLNKVCDALEVEADWDKPKPKLLSLEHPPCTESKKEIVSNLKDKFDIRRSRPILDMAKGEKCVDCGKEDGTIVSCHYNGIMQHQLGQGTGQKVGDDYTMFLCHEHHTETDQKKFTNGIATDFEKLEESHRQAWLIIKTQIVKIKRLEALLLQAKRK
jgi:hypothetical protein